MTGHHEYLSTACLHGEHDYCNATTGVAGDKVPAKCKFCEARCICECHPETIGQLHDRLPIGVPVHLTGYGITATAWGRI